MVEEDILKQHRSIFISASKELVFNNTSSLIDNDIINGIINPPLEAMDVVKQKFLSVAKSNNVILNTDFFAKVLTDYKQSLIDSFKKIGIKRDEKIINYLENFDDAKPLDLIKGLKKELVKFDKEMKKEIKVFVLDNVEEKIISCLDLIYNSEKSKSQKEIINYLQNTYIKQLLEMLDMKLLVKDTILLNSLNEHIERYVFTTENSHLFD